MKEPSRHTGTMFEIDGKVVSLDVIEESFACDLEKCKGACCVQGESGAPLEHSEVELLEKEIGQIRPFLRPDGIRAIEAQGTAVMDADREMVTPLIHGKECAYAVFEGGIARCGIEKAFEAGVTGFRKPVSCHLYPVRVKLYRKCTAVNYDRWPICDPARKCGKRKDLRVFRFVREAIERKFGQDFYHHLELVYNNFKSQQSWRK